MRSNQGKILKDKFGVFKELYKSKNNKGRDGFAYGLGLTTIGSIVSTVTAVGTLHAQEAPGCNPLTLITEFNAGPASSQPNGLSALDGKLYFVATGADGAELRVYDPADGSIDTLTEYLSPGGAPALSILQLPPALIWKHLTGNSIFPRNQTDQLATSSTAMILPLATLTW